MQAVDIFNNNPTTSEVNICSICHENLAENTYTVPECEHVFHSNCMIENLRFGNSSCPLCRSNLINNTYGYERNTKTKIMINYARRKNANKNVVKIVNKYKKIKKQILEFNVQKRDVFKQVRIIQKEHKKIFDEKRSLNRRGWKLIRKLRASITEINNIPIVPLRI